MIDRDELIREAESLDPLPASSAQLSKLLSRDDWSIDDVTKTAGMDPALTGRLLKLANSAAGATRSPITSIQPAVMRLGPGMVMSLAMGQSLHGQLDTSLPAYGLDEGGLWRHSVGAAMGVAAMRSVAKLQPPPGTFIAALVHDVGKLVLGRKLKTLGVTIERDPFDFWLEDEAKLLGIHHAELGGAIARNWELPAGIPEAVAHHHSAEELPEGPERTMARFIAAADAIAHGIEDETAPAYDPIAAEHFGLDPDGQRHVRQAAKELMERVLKLYH